MFRFTHASLTRAVLLAAGVALLAAPAAMATQPKEISYWAQAQTASRAGGTTQLASQAGDRKYGAEVASRAGDRQDGAEVASRATDGKAADQLASQAGDRKYGAAYASRASGVTATVQLASQAGDRKYGAAA